jgi:hypothetical protein
MNLRATGAVAATACVALLASAGGASAATHLKDGGKLTVGGFGGRPPAGVPVGASPSLHAFRVSGHLGCGIVRSVMQKFETNSSSTLTANKPPAPGWTCKLNHHAKAYVCRKGTNAIEDQIVWTLGGHRVGPAPKGP